jgi:hypothetical protein
MHVAKTTSVVLMLFALSACVSPPTIRDSQSTVIGISMRVKAPDRLFCCRPDKVYFVTAERKEDLYTQGRLIEANYTKDNRAYLLNAPQGYYIAVAAYHKTQEYHSTYHYTTIFTQEVVERTAVSVGPGSIAFMGDYVVNQAVDLTNPDEAQISFMPLIDRTSLLRLGVTKEAITAGVAAGMAGGVFSYSGLLGEANRDRRAEETFLEKAMDDLRDGGWSGIVQQRIAALRLNQ